MPNINVSILGPKKEDMSKVIDDLYSAGVRRIHCDVLDGRYNKGKYNIDVISPELTSELKKKGFFVETHLMTELSDNIIMPYLLAKPDRLFIHLEAGPYKEVNRVKGLAQLYGLKTGLAIEPNTPPELLRNHNLDCLLVMSVFTGLSGQKYIDQSDKIRQIREIYPQLPITIDGGINSETIKKVSGVDDAVSASFVLNHPKGYKAALEELIK